MLNGDQDLGGSIPISKDLVSTTGKVFGKRLSEYFAFQKVFLALIALVGVARLGLSLAGVPDGTAKWFSMTVVAVASIFYYGTAVHRRGFGSYKQLLPLLLIQNVLANSIAIIGIALTVAGFLNIFGAPEFSGPFYHSHQWAHILGHVIGGMGVFSIVGWGLASFIMMITKRLAPKPALA
jgi:hypothetical protein